MNTGIFITIVGIIVVTMTVCLSVGLVLFLWIRSFKCPVILIERRGDNAFKVRLSLKAKRIDTGGVVRYQLFNLNPMKKIIIKAPSKSSQMFNVGNADMLWLIKNIDGSYGHVSFNPDLSKLEYIPAEVLYWNNLAKKEAADFFGGNVNWVAWASLGVVVLAIFITFVIFIFGFDAMSSMQCGTKAGESIITNPVIQDFVGG